MLGNNSPIFCCMELVLVSKDSPSKELSNGILNLSRDCSQAEIETFQTRYLKQLRHKNKAKKECQTLWFFTTFPPKDSLGLFFWQ